MACHRTGSTWLDTSLNSHPNIISCGEIFNENNKKKFEYKDANLHLDYIKKIHKDQGKIKDETKFFGFKLLYYQAARLENVHSILEKHIKIIHLKRRRHLMSITSKLLIDNSTRNKIKRPYQAKYIDHNVTIEKKVLVNINNNFKNKEKKWEYGDDLSKNNETIEIWYEDMCLNSEKEHNKILDFLGAKQVPLKSKIIKQRDVLLRDMIVNYGETSQYLIKAL